MTQATHDCDANPCRLCQLRDLYADIFVAVTEDGRSDVPPGTSLDAYVCGHCIPTHSPPIDMDADETQVWEVGSSGWLPGAELTCMDCGEEIDVVVGEPDVEGFYSDDAATEVIPDMEARVRAMHEASES